MPALIISQSQGGVLGQDTLANAFFQANLALGQAGGLNVVTKNSGAAVTYLASDMVTGGVIFRGGAPGPITDLLDTATNIGNYIQSLFPAPISAQPGNAQYPLQAGTIAQTGTPLALNGFQWKFRVVANIGANLLTLGGASAGITYTSGQPGLLTLLAAGAFRDFVCTLTVTGTNAAPVFAVGVVSTGANAAVL